ncbi:MAG: hypothetical protein ACREGC_03600, partial [Minisyncoccia bacterium]
FKVTDFCRAQTEGEMHPKKDMFQLGCYILDQIMDAFITDVFVYTYDTFKDVLECIASMIKLDPDATLRHYEAKAQHLNATLLTRLSTILLSIANILNYSSTIRIDTLKAYAQAIRSNIAGDPKIANNELSFQLVVKVLQFPKQQRTRVPYPTASITPYFPVYTTTNATEMGTMNIKGYPPLVRQ